MEFWNLVEKADFLFAYACIVQITCSSPSLINLVDPCLMAPAQVQRDFTIQHARVAEYLLKAQSKNAKCDSVFESPWQKYCSIRHLL